MSFRTATNVAAYLNKYSEIKFDSTYLAKKDINPQFAEQLYALAPGQVFGPYTDNGYSKLSNIYNIFYLVLLLLIFHI